MVLLTKIFYYFKKSKCVLRLQIKLQECQKRMDELEAELQRANNKVCHTGHLLNQMIIKVNNTWDIICYTVTNHFPSFRLLTE